MCWLIYWFSILDKKEKNKNKSKNKDDKCFQFAAAVALNFEEIESYSERVSNIIPFINKYNWEAINYPSKIDDWKTFEKNNPTITVNILYTKEIEICPAYISNHNSAREKQINLLMIPKEGKEGWHYLGVKNLCIINRNNVKTSWSFLLFELSSFL